MGKITRRSYPTGLTAYASEQIDYDKGKKRKDKKLDYFLPLQPIENTQKYKDLVETEVS